VALFQCPATECDEQERDYVTAVSGLWRIEAEYGDESSDDWLLSQVEGIRTVVVDHEQLLEQVNPRRYGEHLAMRAYIEWAPEWQWDHAATIDESRPF
jgi:hypothetical protein